MFQHRSIIGCTIVAAIVVAFSSSMALADHLDKHETGRIIREVQERSDALQDRIESWASDHHNDHHIDELIRKADELNDAILDFRTQLKNHDEPWDLRDQAQNIVDKTGELGRMIEHGDRHGDFHDEWDATREAVNKLAHHFHLKDVER